MSVRQLTVKVAVCLCVVISAFGAVRPAKAILFSPIKINFIGDPGAILKSSVIVNNDSDQPMVVAPVIRDFMATSSSEQGIPNFDVPANYPFGVQDWVSFGIKDYVLPPKTHFELPFTITIPKDASPGGHYGSILFAKSGQGDKKATDLNDKFSPEVAVESWTGPLIIIRVNGDVLEEGSLLEFKPDRSAYSSLPVKFSTRFQNKGTVHLQPRGKVEIFDMQGNKVNETRFNPDDGNVLPQSVRKFTNTWEWTTLEPKTSELMKEIKNFGIGKYTAKLMVYHGSGNVTNFATTTFWVIPWLLILLAIAALIVLIILIKLYNRSVIKKFEKRQKKNA